MDTPASTPSSRTPLTSSDAIVLLTTWPADRDPAPFARQLVEERLAACVNLLAPMSSIYRWQAAVQEEVERQIVIKSTRARLPALMARLQELHPYDVPECLVLPVETGGAAYLAWVGESVAPE